MNKNFPETTESPFCFSTAKIFRCGCVHLQLKLLTGHHSTATNNLQYSSCNIMAPLTSVGTVLTKSGQHCYSI